MGGKRTIYIIIKTNNGCLYLIKNYYKIYYYINSILAVIYLTLNSILAVIYLTSIIIYINSLLANVFDLK